MAPFIQRYDVPHTGFEFQYLNDLLMYANKIIQEEFDAESGKVHFQVHFGNVPEDKPERKKLTVDEVNADLEKMVRETNQLCDAEGKEYNLTIYTYVWPKDDKPKPVNNESN